MATKPKYNYIPKYEQILNVRNLFVAFKVGHYQAPDRPLVREHLGPHLYPVYVALAGLVGTCGDKGAIHTTAKELAEKMRKPYTYVQQSILTLCEMGYVTRRPVKQSQRWGFTLFVTGNPRHDKDSKTAAEKWYKRRFGVEAEACEHALAPAALKEAMHKPRKWRRTAAGSRDWTSGRMRSGGSTLVPETLTNLGQRIDFLEKYVAAIPTPNLRRLASQAGPKDATRWAGNACKWGAKKLRMGPDRLHEVVYAKERAARAAWKAKKTFTDNANMYGPGYAVAWEAMGRTGLIVDHMESLEHIGTWQEASDYLFSFFGFRN